MHNALKLWAILAAGSAIYGCSAGVAAPQQGLPVVKACFVSGSGSVPVELEVASTPEQRRTGLMGRTAMAPDAGMLFEYQQPRGPDYGFWMFQTLIPLDIAYLDEEGVIGSTRRMAPCTSASGSGCPSYPAGVTFSKAVEMNAGFFREHNLGKGDRLVRGPEPCPAG